MEIRTLLESINSHEDGAQFVIFSKGSVALSAQSKRDGHTAHKVTMMPVVKGVKYADRDSTKEKVENGYQLTHSLPWGEWSTEPGEENLIINHKGNKYLRVYLEGQCMTKYYLDGSEITRDDLKSSGLVNNSFWKPSGDVDVIVINIDNIENII